VQRAPGCLLLTGDGYLVKDEDCRRGVPDKIDGPSYIKGRQDGILYLHESLLSLISRKEAAGDEEYCSGVYRALEKAMERAGQEEPAFRAIYTGVPLSRSSGPSTENYKDIKKARERWTVTQGMYFDSVIPWDALPDKMKKKLVVGVKEARKKKMPSKKAEENRNEKESSTMTTEE